jgi:low temperature requirement protein LtrA
MPIGQFLSGSTMMANLVIGIFFLKFWRKTHDRLFLIFALAFCILAFERVVLLRWGGRVEEVETWVYSVRLVAFLLIIGGVVDKNRTRT